MWRKGERLWKQHFVCGDKGSLRWFSFYMGPKGALEKVPAKWELLLKGGGWRGGGRRRRKIGLQSTSLKSTHFSLDYGHTHTHTQEQVQGFSTHFGNPTLFQVLSVATCFSAWSPTWWGFVTHELGTPEYITEVEKKLGQRLQQKNGEVVFFVCVSLWRPRNKTVKRAKHS